jgi:hypothetical protein
MDTIAPIKSGRLVSYADQTDRPRHAKETLRASAYLRSLSGVGAGLTIVITTA